MNQEFDKQIDSLLRQAAKGENVFAGEALQSGHIDADEISMFAENALPEKAKSRLIKHFADCDRCRLILSNVIALNAEGENAASIPIQAAQTETAAVSNAIPWYKNLFAARNLAFGTGALALIFAVGIGFLVLQNRTNSEMQLAQANANIENSESAPNLSESNSEEMSDADTSTANTNAEVFEGTDMSANTSANPVETNASADSKKSKSLEKSAENKAKSLGRTDSPKKSQTNKSLPEETVTITSNDEKLTTQLPVNGRNAQTLKVTPAPPAPPPPPVPTDDVSSEIVEADESENLAAARTARRKTGTDSGARADSEKRIAGKTFRLRSGVWYDSAYRGQATINVRRGTTQYKNLDSGLQSIGNGFKGTIVVVWKSKAYRIE